MKAVVAAFAVLLVSGSLQAAIPSVMSFDDVVSSPSGDSYERYIVKCNDGTAHVVKKWLSSSLWCLAESDQLACQRQQIKAAVQACN